MLAIAMKQDNTISPIEFARGMTFYLANFDENLFAASHMHCLCDSRTISTLPGDESEGYVTIRGLVDPEGNQGYQYFWVCKSCFHRLQAALEWKVGGDLPPLPRSDSTWARRNETRSPAEIEKLIREFPYSIVGWAPEEIVGIGESQGFAISLNQAEVLLRDNERRIEGAMTSAGYAAIVQLLAGSGLARRKP